MMIQCAHIQKYYGAELVLSDVSFEIKEGETVGLIGRNGTGKTTLMRLLTGSEAPDQGELMIRKDAVTGSLAQIPDYGREETVYDVLRSAFQPLLDAKTEMERLENEMSLAATVGTESALESLLRQYGRLQEMFERGGGYEIEADIDRVAGGIGIPAQQYNRPFSSLSGGEKTKVGLAVILLQDPDILLLDEPTNHLDMAAIEWLEGFLRSFSGTVVVISHDRYFLDAVAEKIIEIEDGEAFTYHCNYSRYKEEKETRLLQQFADYQEQQKKIKKMQETIKQLIEWGNRSNPPNPGFHRRAASMQKALDRMVKLKRPVLERKRIDLQLEQSDRSGKEALILTEVSQSAGGRQLYRRISRSLRYGESAALIGGNGAGKSTLLKSILGIGDAPDEGEIRLGARVETGYLAQESAPSEEEGTVLQFFRDELGMETGEARNQLARFLFYGSDVFKKVRSLSGGEWTRLRLAILMYRKPNLLLLDEPTNHLDIDSREALEEALEEYPGTLLAVSHDRYFINKIAGQVWLLEDGRLSVTLGNFDDFRSERLKRQAAADGNGAGGQRRGAPSGSGGAETDAGAGGQPRGGNAPVEQAGASGVAAAAAMPAGSGAEAGRDAGGRRPKAANPAAVSKLERDIAAAEAELAAVDAAMLAPEAVCDAGRLAALQSERDELQLRIDAMMEQYFGMIDDSTL
ncbi:ATPase subunit of ABC transporter with duplicated ATPase domains [Fontibacillus phaseoli]|uniref:ATPase subunit of ABC transporter with duplicated ATPase domains n=1 Tax=Fontibacillus phaseoli TaxID=1416533 RepID=A0A369BCE8_9BACL|nr:ABC-F family ATP-binding cassette domain-containing protein [Fontibacillus phaseoli]RCX19199.1 ATPase subunit of ABC transporter with duplicated ATPase domains [Fontibacillus phaseoli]